MNTTLFVPKRIKVGFSPRNDTFSGKLSFVTYFDEKNQLRQEKSWNSWRNHSIPAEEYDNVPVSGFFLDRSVGGHSWGWNPRKTYIRIWDPRGFELEIDVPNLMYILCHCDSIAGNGLTGEFVYAWDGAKVVLLPTNAPEYKTIMIRNSKIHASEYVKPKDFVIGHIYKNKQDNELVYLGCFDYWDSSYHNYSYTWTAKKRHHFVSKSQLYDLAGAHKLYWPTTYADVRNKFLEDVGSVSIDDVNAFLKEYERNSHFSPVNESISGIKNFEFDEFESVCRLISEDTFTFRTNAGDVTLERVGGGMYKVNGNTMRLLDVFSRYKPCYILKRLQNGKVHNVDLNCGRWSRVVNFGIPFEKLLEIFEV